MAFLFWSSPAHARSSTSMYRALQPACCSAFHASSDDASLMTVARAASRDAGGSHDQRRRVAGADATHERRLQPARQRRAAARHCQPPRLQAPRACQSPCVDLFFVGDVLS